MAYVRFKHQEILAVLSNEALAMGSIGMQRISLVRWQKPPKGWIKLNADGSMHGDSMTKGARAVLRNEDGVWIQGYSVNLGRCSIEEAELWAVVLHGMKMA